MNRGIIYNIQRYSTHDGPGIRTTVFMKGCPLACWWCHNPEGRAVEPEISVVEERCLQCGACIEVCPQGAAILPNGGPPADPDHCIYCGTCASTCPSEARSFVGREVDVDALLLDLDKDRIFYDESGGGITFSGGEPLMQLDFLLACLAACRERRYHTAVDTSGSAKPGTLERVAQGADLLLFDLKHMDDTLHKRYVGVSNGPILENLRRLSESGHELWIRLPLIPGVNDDEGNIEATAAFVASLSRPHPLQILPYHRVGSDKYRRLGRPYPMSGLQAPSKEQTSLIAEHMRSFGLEVRVGG